MEINILNRQNTVLNKFIAEIRDRRIQCDSMRFRRNLERIGELMAYEISKRFRYTPRTVETPLGEAEVELYDNEIVIATILRAGLPFHQGFLNYFDDAQNAFVSAYRKSKKDGTFTVKVEYISCGSLEGKTMLLVDPMLATGSSAALVYEALVEKGGMPAHTHVASDIGSEQGVDYVQRHMPHATTSRWCAAVDDCIELLRRTQRDYPGVPYFVLGHSMGSFLTRTLLFRYPDAGLRAAVICGTGWQPAPVLAAGLALCGLEKLRLGETGRSKLLANLMFGAYNRKFPDARTPNDWSCSDPEVVAKYTADPLCGQDATIGLTREMLRGIRMIQRPANLQHMDKALPVFFIAGRSDPVGNMGRGVEKAAAAFRAAGMQDVACKLYDGRHEILNEKHRQLVYDDVLAFYERHLD